jgi:hypothetical protein
MFAYRLLYACVFFGNSKRRPAECGYFNYLVFKVQMREAESPPYESTISEKPPDLSRRRICNNVKVFRHAFQNEITHTAAHQICDESVIAKSV